MRKAPNARNPCDIQMFKYRYSYDYIYIYIQIDLNYLRLWTVSYETLFDWIVHQLNRQLLVIYT